MEAPGYSKHPTSTLAMQLLNGKKRLQFLTQSYSILFNTVEPPLIRASDISRKKKQNFAGFSGVNSRKNRPILWEKSHNSREKSADFAGFSREKSQNSPENRSISWNFSRKSQISKDFQGQILRKIGRFPGLFHGKFRGETSPRNNR